jgi:hypothetical protein
MRIAFRIAGLFVAGLIVSLGAGVPSVAGSDAAGIVVAGDAPDDFHWD